MRYVAAYLLAALNNDSPSKADVTKILESVGLDIDDDRLDKVLILNNNLGEHSLGQVS